jgi:predicted NBD/HSP70 family sugar kinase
MKSKDSVIVVDVGGSWVRFANCSRDYQISDLVRLKKPETVEEFSRLLEDYLDKHPFKDVVIAIAGLTDEKRQLVTTSRRVAWGNVAFSKFINRQKYELRLHIINDAQAGAFSVAVRNFQKIERWIYVAIGTSIGIGYVDTKNPGVIENSEAGHMMIGEKSWEQIAAGPAFLKHFDCKASAANQEQWREYANLFAPGLWNSVAILQPEMVFIGGGVGQYLGRSGIDQIGKLFENWNSIAGDVVIQPKIRVVANADQANLLGAGQAYFTAIK